MSAIWTEQLLLVWPNLHTPLLLQSHNARAWMRGEEEAAATYAIHHVSLHAISA